MVRTILPELIVNALANLNMENVYEIRIRRNSPVVINYLGKNKVLTTNSGEKIFASNNLIESIIKKATEYSLYAYNNQIKQGFITARGGIRIGIAGESVNSDNFMPTTIKNIHSLNIRIPHEVMNCSILAFKFIYSQEFGLKNTLIIAPPGAGKTTFLRDIARNLSINNEKIYNTLVVDERFEICSTLNGEPMLNVGEYTDIISGAGKMFAFTNAIRAMKPDVIITDELMGIEDSMACIRAIRSGVKIIASVHGNNFRELIDKPEYKELLNGGYFERIVVLSSKGGPGKIEGIFDENLKCIYF